MDPELSSILALILLASLSTLDLRMGNLSLYEEESEATVASNLKTASSFNALRMDRRMENLSVYEEESVATVESNLKTA